MDIFLLCPFKVFTREISKTSTQPAKMNITDEEFEEEFETFGHNVESPDVFDKCMYY